MTNDATERATERWFCTRHNMPVPVHVGEECTVPHPGDDPDAEHCGHGFKSECRYGCREWPEEDAGQDRSSVPDTRGEERGTVDPADLSLYFNVAQMLDEGIPDPPEPVLLRRTDGHAIFYAGQVNLLFGDPESGKTFVAQAASAEALCAGRKVLFVDIDHNGPAATISRFLDMGVPETALRDVDRFRYIEPEDKVQLLLVVAQAKLWRPAVAVVDSIGELLPLFGLSSNSPDDFTTAHAKVLKPLARAGAAVLAIDHLPKNSESRASGPTGTIAKKRAVGGVSIRVTVAEAFTPGKGGSAVLTVNKDRHGGLRKYCPLDGKEPTAGVFRIEPSDHAIKWALFAPKGGEGIVVAGVDQADVDALDLLDPPPKSVSDVKNRMHWASQRATDVLREWRRSRSSGTDGERGTAGKDLVPRSSTPYVGNGERS